MFPYVRKNQLQSIPVAVPTQAQQQEVIALVQEVPALKAEEPTERKLVKVLVQQIDDLIAATYVG